MTSLWQKILLKNNFVKADESQSALQIRKMNCKRRRLKTRQITQLTIKASLAAVKTNRADNGSDGRARVAIETAARNTKDPTTTGIDETAERRIK